MKYGTAIAAVTLFVAAGRFCIPGHDVSWAGSYEAFAHIWVGVLLCIAFCSRFTRDERLLAGYLLAVITILELVMFVLR